MRGTRLAAAWLTYVAIAGFTVATLLVPLACAGIAGLIALRRSRDLYALFSWLEILLFGCLIAGTLSVAPAGDGWSLATRTMQPAHASIWLRQPRF